jgi:hypothetical protein
MTIQHTHHGPVIETMVDRYGGKRSVGNGSYALQTAVHSDDVEGIRYILPIIKVLCSALTLQRRYRKD